MPTYRAFFRMPLGQSSPLPSESGKGRPSARRLSTMLLIYALALILLFWLHRLLPNYFGSRDFVANSRILGALLAVSIAYGLARVGRSCMACSVVVASSVLEVTQAVATAPSSDLLARALPWFVINTIICSLALSIRANLVASGFVTAAYFFLIPFMPRECMGSLLVSCLCYVATSGIALVGTAMRRQAERVIREREKVISATLDNAAVGILQLESGGRIMLANPFFLKLLGYSGVELGAMSMREITHAEDVQESDAGLLRMHNGESDSFQQEKRYLRKDGSYVWGHVSARLIRDARFRPKYVVAIVQDLSARKESERVIELQRTKIISASKMSVLGEMSGGIAHEINNPLTIIHGKAHQLRALAAAGLATQEKTIQIAEKIDATSMRISKIVRALRCFARDATHDPFQATSMESILEDTLELCNERYRNHGIALRIDPLPANADLECQPVQVSQVLLNLLNNAHDAVENLREKWVQVSVSETRTHIEVAITDSGPGIAPELLEKILMPFFSTKEVGKGTGLGLSISIGIVQAHQGTLIVDVTCPNTRFVVTLPKRQGALLTGSAA